MAYNDSDFRLKKSDRYIPEGLDMARLAEIEPKILAAIENKSCTLPQIKRFAEISAREDISKIIEAMEEKGVIVRLYNGIYTGFFLNQKGKIPTKFWVVGNNQVDMSFENISKPVSKPKFEPAPNPSIQPREGLSGNGFMNHLRFINQKWSAKPQPKPDNAVIPKRVIEKELLNEKKESASSRPKKKHGITLKSLEITAERQFDIWSVAKFYKITVRELKMIMRRDEEYQEAYNRGRRRKMQSFNNKKEEEIMMREAKSESRVKKGIEYTESMFEEFGRKGLSLAEAGRSIGVQGSSIQYQLKKPKFLEAFNRGKQITNYKSARKKAAVPAKTLFSNSNIEPENGIILNQLPMEDFEAVDNTEAVKSFESFSSISEPVKSYEGFPDAPQQIVEPIVVSDSRLSETLDRLDRIKEMKFSQKENFVEGSFGQILSSSMVQKTVELGNGSVISISLVNFNPFTAELKDRHFIESLVNLVQEFSE